MKVKRTAVAFLAAAAVPLIVALAGAFVYWALLMIRVSAFGAKAQTDIRDAIIMLPTFLLAGAQLAALIVLPITLLIGIPVYEILQNRGIVAFRWYVLIGAGLSFGTLVVELLLGIFPVSWLLHDLQSQLVVIGTMISGPLATAAFWRVRRPDRESDS